MVMVAIFVLSIAATVFAWPGYAQGRSIELGDKRGYFIWHDDEGYYHLWSSTRRSEHQFSGKIYTNGYFVDVRGRRLEGGDWLEVRHEGHEIKFEFNTGSHGEDGLKFRVAGGDHVHFKLFIDGEPITPERILVGHDSWNPDSNDFVIYR